MATSFSTTAPGLAGWATQAQPTTASAPGLRGWAAQARPTTASAPGLRGWAAGYRLNLRLTVLLPPTQAPADTLVPLDLVLTYQPTEAGASPVRRGLPAYVAPGPYALSVPPDVLLTLTGTSPRYQLLTQTLTLAPGQVAELTLQLAFRTEALPQSTKVRRRPGPPTGLELFL
ncbi:hypothetical protein GCM10027422_43400 [Hymenobacter arcticus]